MVRTCKTLTIAEIVKINRDQIESTGCGFFIKPDNFHNKSSLEYALTAVTQTIFGQHLYPTIIDKAAFLGWEIMRRHIFHDGNKRTGMTVCFTFLEINDYEIRIKDEDVIEVIDIAERVAGKEPRMELDEFKSWLESKTGKTGELFPS